MNFMVEIRFDALRRKKIPEEASEFREERHTSHLITASAKPGR